MKYEVGDKVKIKCWNNMVDEFGFDDTYNTIHTPSGFTKTMSQYCNTIMTIKSVKENYYEMKEDNGLYFWDECVIKGWINVKDQLPELTLKFYYDKIVQISDPVKIKLNNGDEHIGRYVFSITELKYALPRLYWKICSDINLDKIDWENDLEIEIDGGDCWMKL